MGEEWVHRKQITFRGLQMFHQSRLSIDIRVVTKLLHEGAFLPATWEAAASCHSLSVSSRAVKTERRFFLVPEAEHVKPASTPSPQRQLGDEAGRLQTQPAAFTFLSPRQSIIPEPSSLIPSKPLSPPGTWQATLLTTPAQSHQPSYSKTINILLPKRKQNR